MNSTRTLSGNVSPVGQLSLFDFKLPFVFTGRSREAARRLSAPVRPRAAATRGTRAPNRRTGVLRRAAGGRRN